MPAAPSPKKAPSRRVAHVGRAGILDLFSITAGLALCSGIGYVAYRTQIRGEELDRVFPFLAEDRRPAKAVKPAGKAATEPGSGRNSGNVAKPAGDAGAAGDGKDDAPQDDPDNTYFGRRIRGRNPDAPR